MVTYLYWILVVLMTVAALYFMGIKHKLWKPALISAAVIVVLGVGSFYFYFEQVFVKRWGGIMTIKIPDGHYHIGATWKYDNLWIENYDPKTNLCHFSEYSRGNLLEGRVTMKDCNPLMPDKPTTE